MPTSGQIHAGVTGGCNACHDTGASWMGVSNYPISPATFVMGARYTGFHPTDRQRQHLQRGRPGAPGQRRLLAVPQQHELLRRCSVKPANHIPTAATAQCTACHTTGDFDLPTLANIHANAPSTTSNCAQCHGAAAPTFAIPARLQRRRPALQPHPDQRLLRGLPRRRGFRLPTLPVPNGARFSGSAMSHAGITANCAACHRAGHRRQHLRGHHGHRRDAADLADGRGSHIPSSSSCESCHLGSLANVSGLIPASTTRTAPGTLFATPLPTSSQIHSGRDQRLRRLPRGQRRGWAWARTRSRRR